jgi:NAD(P)-dependent dehydrogenase (short-subunit alcohol dehydrogenase family)/catechol 2,3-dioxygenase-like lactoylglutathione lyase family enzyme
MELKGKNAIVTGAARGIGRGIAMKLAAAGANVALIDLGNPADRALTYNLGAQADLNRTVDVVKKLGVKAIPILADVTRFADLERMASEVVAKLGAIDILVNNAGIIAVGPVSDFAEDAWDRVMGGEGEGPVSVRQGVPPAHGEAERGRDREYRVGGGQDRPRRRGGVLREQVRGGRFYASARGRAGTIEHSRQRGMPRISAHCDVDRRARSTDRRSVRSESRSCVRRIYCAQHILKARADARRYRRGRRLFVPRGKHYRRDDQRRRRRRTALEKFTAGELKMIKLKAFNHAAFRVSDVEKATAFYENVVGLKRIPRPNFGFGGAWYGIGNNALHIISSENRGQKPDPLGAHVAFDVEDFDETKRTLKEMGIEFLEAPANMGAGRQLWILDPDGNTVELRTEK